MPVPGPASCDRGDCPAVLRIHPCIRVTPLPAPRPWRRPPQYLRSLGANGIPEHPSQHLARWIRSESLIRVPRPPPRPPAAPPLHGRLLASSAAAAQRTPPCGRRPRSGCRRWSGLPEPPAAAASSRCVCPPAPAAERLPALDAALLESDGAVTAADGPWPAVTAGCRTRTLPNLKASGLVITDSSVAGSDSAASADCHCNGPAVRLSWAYGAGPARQETVCGSPWVRTLWMGAELPLK